MKHQLQQLGSNGKTSSKTNAITKSGLVCTNLNNQQIKNKIDTNSMTGPKNSNVSYFNYAYGQFTSSTPTSTSNKIHGQNRIYVNDEMLKYQMILKQTDEKSAFEQLDDLIKNAAKNHQQVVMDSKINLKKDDSYFNNLPVLLPLPLPTMAPITRFPNPSHHHSQTQQHQSHNFPQQMHANSLNTNTVKSNSLPQPIHTKSTERSLLYQYENNIPRGNRSSSSGSKARNDANSSCCSSSKDANDELIYKLNQHIYNKQIARSEDNLKTVENGSNSFNGIGIRGTSMEKRTQTTKVLKIDQGSPPPPPPRLKISLDAISNSNFKLKTRLPSEKLVDLNIVLNKTAADCQANNKRTESNREKFTNLTSINDQISLLSSKQKSLIQPPEKLKSNSLTSVKDISSSEKITENTKHEKGKEKNEKLKAIESTYHSIKKTEFTTSPEMKSFNKSFDNVVITNTNNENFKYTPSFLSNSKQPNSSNKQCSNNSLSQSKLQNNNITSSKQIADKIGLLATNKKNSQINSSFSNVSTTSANNQVTKTSSYLNSQTNSKKENNNNNNNESHIASTNKNNNNKLPNQTNIQQSANLNSKQTPTTTTTSAINSFSKATTNQSNNQNQLGSKTTPESLTNNQLNSLKSSNNSNININILKNATCSIVNNKDTAPNKQSNNQTAFKLSSQLNVTHVSQPSPAVLAQHQPQQSQQPQISTTTATESSLTKINNPQSDIQLLSVETQTNNSFGIDNNSKKIVEDIQQQSSEVNSNQNGLQNSDQGSVRMIVNEINKNIDKQASSIFKDKETNKEPSSNFVRTPLLDAITNTAITKSTNNQICLSSSSSSATPEVSPILSPALLNEFKTSLYVGSDFTSDDITVQLIDNFSGFKVSKKLFVHCFRIEPISNKSVTLTSGQLVTPTTIDLDLTNGTNYLRKELKKDIYIPNNADINTLESYLENGYLVIKCLIKKEDQESGLVMDDCRRSPVYSSTPVYNKTSSKYMKQMAAAEFEIKTSDNSIKDLSPLEITINSRTNDSQDLSTANFVFENPLYNNSAIQQQANPITPIEPSSKSILKNAHDINPQEIPTTVGTPNFSDLINNPDFLINSRKARKLKELKRKESTNPLCEALKREKSESLNRTKRQGRSEKRHYKSTEYLNENFNGNHHRVTSTTNQMDNLNYDRTLSFFSNPISKSVRFDINEKSTRKDHNQTRSESNSTNHHANSTHRHQNHRQRHRSTSSKSRSVGASERSSMSASASLSGLNKNKQQIINNAPNVSRLISNDSIQDGFNCITKDALDNIYLTYFFKLPSCSPSDRTQVRIEDNNILKLKIIQERNFAVKPKKEKRKTNKYSNQKRQRHHSQHKSQKQKCHKFPKNNIDNFSLSSSSSEISSLCTSVSSCCLSSSSTSVIYECLNNDTNRRDQEHENDDDDDDEQFNSSDSSMENITCFNHQGNDKTKIVLREFSRRCRLPDNLFKFDPTGVSVSFINNVWVRIEIPIIEFIDFSSNIIINSYSNVSSSNSANNANCANSNINHHYHTSSINTNLNIPNSTNSNGKKKQNFNTNFEKQYQNYKNERENDYRLRKTSSNEFFFLNEVKI